jgi:hypothetical protein
LKHVQTIDVALNNTKLVIGSIEHIFINDELIAEDGNLKLDANNALSIVGLENYYSPNLIKHMPYAKAENKPDFNT